MKPHAPQMPSRQSWSNAIGSLPSCIRRSLTVSSISRNDMSGLTPGTSYVSNFPGASDAVWRHAVSVMRKVCAIVPLLVRTRRRVHELVVQRFLVQLGLVPDALPLPRPDVHEVLVVA